MFKRDSKLMLACAALCCGVAGGLLGADAALPKPKAEVKEEGELKLDWALQPYIAGPLFFLSVHRSGVINVFNRDEKTGDVKFLSAIPVAKDLGREGTHLDMNLAFSAKNIIYASGSWTHAHGDGDSIGLNYYQVEPKDGTFKKLGTLPCSAGVLYASPDPNTLYLSAYFATQIHVIKLDPASGKPTVAEKLTGKGMGAGLVLSPDKKFCYTLGADGAVSWLACGADGKLAPIGSLALPEMTISGAGDFCLFGSPDGKHVYTAVFKRYDRPENAYLASFKRDEKTGALTFIEKLPPMSTGGLTQVSFAPDGLTAYFCAEPEHPASGLGILKRDPETGKLSGQAMVPGANPASRFAYASDTGTLYLGGTWSIKSFRIFEVPKAAVTAAKP